MEVSRRNFLKGALVASAGAAAITALPGCSPLSNTGGTAEKSASNGIGRHTWEVAPEPITDIAETKDFDVVVVGGGIAGTSCAQAAARFGAKVALIERNAEGRFCGADLAAIGSDVLKRAGRDVSAEEAAHLQYLAGQQTANYNLIRMWADQCGPVIDYIEELCGENGVELIPAGSGGTAKAGWDQLDETYRVLQDAVRFSHSEYGIFGRPDGKEPHQNLGDVLVKSAEDNGVEIFYQTHAEQLVGSATDGVTGVIAEAEDGSYVQFNASKGVVLCTGDIGGNEEMIDAWTPICNRADTNAYTPAGSNSGDAITMASWIGGGISKSPAAPMVHQFTIDTRGYQMTAFNMTFLAVNGKGQRFMNEMPFEPYVTDARMNTPGNIAWTIFDADYPKYVQSQFASDYEEVLEPIPAEIEDRIASGDILTANSIEELASLIDVPADTLAKTIETFNGMYDKGEDTQFGVMKNYLSQVKTAPFYATPVHASILCICYGAHVNDDSQVCTDDDQPIPGLFAAGNAQGDFFGFNYPVHCPGCSTSRGLVYGQLIGEALAKDTTITELFA